MEISRELLSDQVYDMIRESILNGTREPGSRIVESDIARQLGVSQAPVREAIKRLVHEGLAEAFPRRGSYVKGVSAEEFAAAREMRASLESTAARTVVERVQPDDLENLRAIVTKMTDAVEASDWASFRMLDVGFHRQVVGLAGQSVLDRIWAVLEPVLLSQQLIGDPKFDGDRIGMVALHDDLVDALLSGNPDEAANAFAAHARG